MNAQRTEPRRNRRRSGSVTLHDVAKLAGVAPITASRALNTPERVSPEVLQRIRDAVARTGYVPNLLAGSLASARSRLVAAVVPTVSGPVFLETIEALTMTLADHGYQLMLGQSGYTNSREEALLDAIIGRRPDGIVLTGVVHSARSRNRLAAAGIPVVETWDLTPTPIDMLVGFSHSEVGSAIARFLLQRKRRRLAVIATDDERSVRRHRAFMEEARAGGVKDVPVIAVPAPATMRSGREGLAALLGRKSKPDAVFCSSDLVALGALTEAHARGVAVPAALAVVGFGNLAFAADVEPPLTTVRIDGTAMGRRAAQFIVDRAHGIDPEPRVVDLGFSIVERGSA
jgi:LacI family gluconate utilization system Gnt-I transcriptional repressor